MSDRLLAQVVVLRCDEDPDHPVWDLERLCRVVLDSHIRATRHRLEPADYDEALSYLLGESYILTPRYRAGRGGVPFAAWIQGQLSFRVRDHMRAPYGKRAEHRIGQGRFAELDAPGPNHASYQGDNDGECAAPGLLIGGTGDTVGPALAALQGDSGDDRGEALGGYDASRDRDVLREVARLGLSSGRGDAQRDRREDAEPAVAAGPWADCPACGWRTYLTAPNGLPGWHLEECGGCGLPLEGPELPTSAAA